MRLLSACVGLLVVYVVASSQDLSHKDMTEIEGQWCGVRVASNMNWFDKKKDDIDMCKAQFKITSSGDIKETKWSTRDKHAAKEEILFRKTDKQGKYTYHSSLNHETDVYFVYADRKCLITRAEYTKSGEKKYLLNLFAKRSAPEPNCKAKFRSIAEALEISDSITSLSERGHCSIGFPQRWSVHCEDYSCVTRPLQGLFYYVLDAIIS
ncbi:lipocalin-like [Protopterus annectens]|uniref:lipocalin-like n=1 Tax=Protopterus annectens TaxID=7888 RepID=UPI001CFAE03D|nr:lipocalin-like [Protopterus annectens]